MVNVFSFCLYGPENPRYYDGLLVNVTLINEHFPDWKIFVYIGNDVPSVFVSELRKNASIVIRETGVVGHVNSVHRFFAIDEVGVDLMMVRDADSRVHWKDRWAIRDFLQRGYGVHVIRDHKEHVIEMLAGLWGMRKGVISTTIRELYDNWTPTFAGSGSKTDPLGFGIDQNFLKLVLYQKVKKDILVHCSNHATLVGEVSIEFPFEWKNDLYCGRVELDYNTPSPPPQKKKNVLQLPNIKMKFDTAIHPTQREAAIRAHETSQPFLNFLNRK